MHSRYATFFLSALILASPACKFNEGCTDRQADNYDKDAEFTCCCEYSGEAVFYYDKHTSDSLLRKGIYSISYYIDSINIANTYAGISWDPPPSCGQDGAITIHRILEGTKSASWLVKMRDHHHNVIIEKNVTWKADSCIQVKFNF